MVIFENIIVKEEGYYKIVLLWKDELDLLNNCVMVVLRFCCIEKKFKKNLELVEKY